MKYIRRLADQIIDSRSKAFNALNITGPKGCGKTRTCKERCKTIIEFQDESRRQANLQIAETAPNLFFRNERPILFDEWQDAPKIWGAVRKECDDRPEDTGSFYLTGSSSRKIKTPHTGTGRISSLTMYPMTLWESGESNGSVSLEQLFEEKTIKVPANSSIELEDYFFLICRGGWPRCLELKDKAAQLEVGKDYYRQIYNTDISYIDDVKRDPEIARTLIWSYARNAATLAKKTSIYADVKANYSVSDPTLASYVSALERLFVIRDIDAWTPQIRSKTAVRSSKKHIFLDTSIATSALGISPKYFNSDLDSFGHLFENMVIRDLLAYSEVHNAHVKHYRDDTGMEVDAVYEKEDGRYALIEIKTGVNKIPEAEKNLLGFKDLIKEHNRNADKDPAHPGVKYREPSLLIVICANAPMAYTTEKGISVIPFSCLKD
ncbi:MAG: ATP-binding protein [Erysipelotrichaceae bacterium]|nr:ATP-binding protein [Erysipelotrichaceae bacterium]